MVPSVLISCDMSWPPIINGKIFSVGSIMVEGRSCMVMCIERLDSLAQGQVFLLVASLGSVVNGHSLKALTKQVVLA